MTTFRGLFVIAFVFLSFSATAEKMDLATHSLLITKLESVMNNLSERQGATKQGIQARLADLYAERARLKSLEDYQKNCADCDSGKQDRFEALRLYTVVFHKLEGDHQGKALMQMSHLYQRTNQLGKSEKLLQSVLRNPKQYNSRTIGMANGLVGDIYYRKGQFKTAQGYFERAIANKQTPARGYATYRLAWCQLNQGQVVKAESTMVGLLRNSELLQTQSLYGEDIDASFHKDAARDYATFIARGKVTPGKIDQLMELSPDEDRKSNLQYLGEETDRLGNREGSVMVWARYSQENDLKPGESLEIQVRIALVNYGRGQKQQSFEDLQVAFKMWKEKGCKNEELCSELQAKIRSMIINWNKSEKIKPSNTLIDTYEAFNNHFPKDVEMQFWAAQAARVSGQFARASQLYRKTSITAADLMRSAKGEEKEKIKKTFEGSLLSDIEMAEASKDLKTREDAYNHYLKINPDGDKAFETRYQRAHVYTEMKQSQKASEEFYALAMSSEKNHQDLKEKSADLALDELAVLKEDAKLEAWALTFMRKFPKKSQEFARIARRSIVNQAVAANNNPSNSDGKIESALRHLNEAPLQGATKDELITISKTKMLMGERVKDLKVVRNAADEMLKIKGVSTSDREMAMKRKLWVAELELDFATAFDITKKLKISSMSEEDRLLKLAMLAELSGRPSRGYYEQYLQRARNSENANIVRAKIVKSSGNPWRELSRQQGNLSRTPRILADLALEIYANHKDMNGLSRVLKVRGVRETAAGQTMARFLFFRDFQPVESKIRRTRLYSSSDALLRKTLQERVKNLRLADDWANRAIRMGDWSTQVITLAIVSQENGRLYNDLMKMPLPRGIKGPQVDEYKRLLTSQAEPFRMKHEDVENKLKEMWNARKSLNPLLDAYADSRGPIRKILSEELRSLARYAPNGASSDIRSALNDRIDMPSTNSIQRARVALKNDPFDKSRIEHLKKLEIEKGTQASNTMVAYLDLRLNEMQKGARQ